MNAYNDLMSVSTQYKFRLSWKGANPTEPRKIMKKVWWGSNAPTRKCWRIHASTEVYHCLEGPNNYIHPSGLET